MIVTLMWIVVVASLWNRDCNLVQMVIILIWGVSASLHHTRAGRCGNIETGDIGKEDVNH